jgi:hypothetical protein
MKTEEEEKKFGLTQLSSTDLAVFDDNGFE